MVRVSDNRTDTAPRRLRVLPGSRLPAPPLWLRFSHARRPLSGPPSSLAAELEYDTLPKPTVFSIAEKSSVTDREQLLENLRAASVPTVPLLRASNYHARCGPSTATDDEDKFCVLLFVPIGMDGGWPKEAIHALQALRATARTGSSVQFSWVDALRQGKL